MQEKPEHVADRDEAEKSRALGLFLAFFGAVVFIAIFFTPGTAGKIANFVSSLLLAGSGGLIAYLGHRKVNRSQQS